MFNFKKIIQDQITRVVLKQVSKHVARRIKMDTGWSVTDVPIKSWWESKVNWAQIVGFLAMVATFFGYTVPEDMVTQTVVWIGATQAFISFIVRTWFTKALTWGSVDEVVLDEDK